jgi:hypothetical protein
VLGLFNSFFFNGRRRGEHPHLNCIDKMWHNHKSTTSSFKENKAKPYNAQLIRETGLFNSGLMFPFLGMFAIGTTPTGVIAMKIHDRSTGSDIQRVILLHEYLLPPFQIITRFGISRCIFFCYAPRYILCLDT